MKKSGKCVRYPSAKKIEEKPELLKLAGKLQKLKTRDEVQRHLNQGHEEVLRVD